MIHPSVAEKLYSELKQFEEERAKEDDVELISIDNKIEDRWGGDMVTYVPYPMGRMEYNWGPDAASGNTKPKEGVFLWTIMEERRDGWWRLGSWMDEVKHVTSFEREREKVRRKNSTEICKGDRYVGRTVFNNNNYY
jgi:hypothetical protein